MATAGLRTQYAEALEKFHIYERGLLFSKQDVRNIGPIHPSCYTDEQQESIAEYRAYKFVVKSMAKDLRELKSKIREYDRTHSGALT